MLERSRESLPSLMAAVEGPCRVLEASVRIGWEAARGRETLAAAGGARWVEWRGRGVAEEGIKKGWGN